MRRLRTGSVGVYAGTCGRDRPNRDIIQLRCYAGTVSAHAIPKGSVPFNRRHGYLDRFFSFHQGHLEDY